jgi:hypothetical protein
VVQKRKLIESVRMSFTSTISVQCVCSILLIGMLLDEGG